MSSYTIQILVVDGKQDGIKLYNRPVDWSGEIITFPRHMTKDLKGYVSEDTNGIYVLWAKLNNAYEIYVGKSDDILNRLKNHLDQKDFWTNALIMVSGNNILNSAHVGWLEHVLVQKVSEVSRHKVHNGNKPRNPKLNLQDQTLAQNFLDRLEGMLPIIGLPLFEENLEDEKIEENTQSNDLARATIKKPIDTLLVPTGKYDDGFEQVFLNEHSWYYLRVSEQKTKNFKYIAAYQPAPVSAVTHFAEISHFETVMNEKGQPRLKAVFKSPAEELKQPIPFGTAKGGSLQGPRYVNLDELRASGDLGKVL